MVLISSPATAANDVIHQARLFNLIEYFAVHGIVAVTEDKHQRFERVVLTKREGWPSDDELVARRRLGVPVETLDWTDIDKFDKQLKKREQQIANGQTPTAIDSSRLTALSLGDTPKRLSALLIDPAEGVLDSRSKIGRTAVDRTMRSAPKRVQARKSADYSGSRPIFATAAYPRVAQLDEGVVLASDGSFSVWLDGDDLFINRLNGSAPERVAKWVSARGLQPAAKLIAAAQDGANLAVIVSDQAGAHNAVRMFDGTWTPLRLVRRPLVGGALVRDDLLVVDGQGWLSWESDRRAPAFSDIAVLAGVDALQHKAATVIVGWGTDSDGAPLAEVLVRGSRETWTLIDSYPGVVRAGIVRSPTTPPRDQSNMVVTVVGMLDSGDIEAHETRVG